MFARCSSALRKLPALDPLSRPAISRFTKKTFVFTSMIMILHETLFAPAVGCVRLRHKLVTMGERGGERIFTSARGIRYPDASKTPLRKPISASRISGNNFTYFSASCRGGGKRQRSLDACCLYAREAQRGTSRYT